MTWHDAAVAREFIDVMHLQRAPLTLMRPSVMMRALLPTSSADHQSRPVRG
ncbi:hypothetical protein [Mycobacterium camsae]|uniref:hypothetical protein n=1 Tax=Mycobacterium gordonae TaxID=1778 RepID=UPI00197FE273|nr:hypothetical protein [Mycobacterium gordonae]